MVGFWPSSLGTATKSRSMKIDAKHRSYSFLNRTTVNSLGTLKRFIIWPRRLKGNSFSRETPRGQDARVANENACDHTRSRIPPYTVNARPPRGGWGGGVLKIFFIQGGPSPRSNPLPFYLPFFTKKAFTFY